jgi:hypothetical protein
MAGAANAMSDASMLGVFSVRDWATIKCSDEDDLVTWQYPTPLPVTREEEAKGRFASSGGGKQF